MYPKSLVVLCIWCSICICSVKAQVTPLPSPPPRACPDGTYLAPSGECVQCLTSSLGNVLRITKNTPIYSTTPSPTKPMYEAVFSFELNMDADIDTKHRIRNETALALNIAAMWISLLQIEGTRTEARRLLSLVASFTVESSRAMQVVRSNRGYRRKNSTTC